MTDELSLEITLLSDTTFGRGDGVVGLVDEEIEHDAQTGLPIIRGRTLKGLLVEACADILYALGNPEAWTKEAEWLFGKSGSDLSSQAHMRIGRAELPSDLVRHVKHEIKKDKLTATQVLESLTSIRRQTAVDEGRFGVPQDRSLRSARVLMRGLTLTAPLSFDQTPTERQLALLAACAAGVKRGGSGRNRGRGRLHIALKGAKQSHEKLLEFFAKEIGVAQA
jgi:hypothetical protein